MILWELFVAFFKIGAFAIGGGYAILPLISEQVVQQHGWLTTQEFTDILTISQMTPGPIAVNASTFAGMRVAGFSGALAATLGCIIMGILISLLLYFIFKKFSYSPYIREVLTGFKAASAGFIMSAALVIVLLAFFPDAKTDYFAILIFASTFLLSRKYHLNPILLMVFSGVLGIMFYL